MFYVNNKQVLGIFLNGNNYNYMSFGFGRIIPENRNAQFAYINLAQRYLSQYRVEYGNIQSGYDNFPVARLDYPVNGIFHSPLTYYYGGNIVPTKNVPVYINNGYGAIRGTVYNDINVNGNIVYFAANADFQGHNVNIHPENFRSTSPYFNGTVMDNCSNFTLRSFSRLSKSSQATLYDCKKFIGWFNFFGDNDGTRYPGFRGFLHTCRDGVFSFNLMNMHGGGDGTYNFSCIANCNNIKLNINGSSWQAWVHPNCYSDNCNITTRYIVPGFDHMDHCNFNLYIPSHADVEKSAFYSILSNSNNCNVYFDGLNSNLYSFRNKDWNLFLFEDLNDCNLNLLLNNSTGLDFAFGNRLNNCNIHFMDMGFKQQGFGFMNNCTLTGNFNYANIWAAFVYSSRNVNLNIDARNTSDMILLWNVDSATGNANLSNETNIKSCSNSILNLYNGNILFNGVEHSIFNLNGTNASFTSVNNTYARVYNTTFNCHNTNYTEIYSDGGGTSITGADNCYNLKLSGLTFKTPDSDSLFENVYNSDLKFGTANPYYRLWRVENCTIGGFPIALTYVKNCVFYPFTMISGGLANSEVGTWSNVWTHNRTAGIRSNDYISNCRIYANTWASNGSITFENSNNMQTSFGSYYNGTVTANLPIYNMNIKLNVDCATLNLGIFQAGPPHGFQNATISANTIYAKGNMSSAYVQVNCDTKIYCENYCDVCFRPYVSNINSVLQPVVLINNYDHANSGNQSFFGGLTRIGSLSTRTGPRSLFLYSGACVFINNAVLGNIIVDNSLLFVGSNYDWTGTVNVTNGGRIVTLSDWDSNALSLVTRSSFAWNIWDSGPWGSQRLIDYCISV